MKFIIISTLAFCILLNLAGTMPVTKPSCSVNSTVHDLRIRGCTKQPCTIRKGVPLPFELDFSFTTPKSSSRPDFYVMNPYYAVPPNAFGEKISSANCQKGFTCPLRAGRHTLKSNLFIDKKAVCTAGCDGLKNNTGLRNTYWTLSIGADEGSSEKDSFCSFQVQLNIVN